MKLFLKKIVLFIIFLAALLIVLLTLIIFLNKKRILNCPVIEKTETIILGDSHIMWSIDDGKLGDVRNFSLNAEGYIYTFAKLKYLLKQNNNIKKIYLGLSYHNLSGYYDDYLFGAQALIFFNRYIKVLDLADYLALVLRNPKNMVLMPPIILRTGVENLIDGSCEFLGSFPEEKMLQTYSRVKMHERIAAQYYFGGIVAPFSKLNIRYFDKILDLCRKHNIKIVALCTPMQKDYRKLIPDTYICAYDQFVKERSLCVYNFDDLNLSDSCYLPDGDHVNYFGAMIITEHFREYLANEAHNEF